MDSIVADTSFFSCFHCHLQDNYLDYLLTKYSFFIGNRGCSNKLLFEK
jgi:hypothetical protein